ACSHALRLLVPRQPAPTLFPYTTLFRSGDNDVPRQGEQQNRPDSCGPALEACRDSLAPADLDREPPDQHTGRGQLNDAVGGSRRSEEHTSELQSREKLVCRLLLEKKKHT